MNQIKTYRPEPKVAFTIRLPAPEARRARKAARVENLTVNAWVNQVIAERLDRDAGAA